MSQMVRKKKISRMKRLLEIKGAIIATLLDCKQDIFLVQADWDLMAELVKFLDSFYYLAISI